MRENDGLVPLLLMLTVVVGLWIWIVNHEGFALPPRFGRRQVTGPFAGGNRFPPAPPLLTRDAIDSKH